ncbi:hypothetical protein HU200_005781 [Digitaria exilis]|uniref:Uncharacterized protein n=1 Tax=Digitaria exilis TaxID=1010633 RepID=A0A835FTR0_9POAL|nr:hypothetical protein HU200_005781 [Digitaria exilis]
MVGDPATSRLHNDYTKGKVTAGMVDLPSEPDARSKQKGFDSLFAIVSWQLWKERNAWVFRGAESQPAELLRRIQKEGEDWISAGAKHLGCLFTE